MAKQKHERTERQARASLVNLCAFIALFLAAFLYVLGPILNLFDSLHTIVSVLNLLASYSLLIAIALPAWNFVCHKTKGWRICYIVALIIYIVGVMLGFVLPIVV